MLRIDAVYTANRGCASADGIIVSNHGGRQLDGAGAPLRMLPGIAGEAGGMTVMMDSGIRRGTDVPKALALGAQFVFVGRPFLYAAAIAGEPGVRHAIKLLRDEIDRDMALIGITTLAEMRRELLTPARGAGFLGGGSGNGKWVMGKQPKGLFPSLITHHSSP